MKGILRAVGGFLKGKVTIVGTVLTALGIGTGGGDVVMECAKKLGESPDTALSAVGALLMVFGFARKAGWVAGEAKR